jgi:hypothetical protein
VTDEILFIYCLFNDAVGTCTCLLAEIISSTLKMEAISSSETLVDTQRTTWRYIPEVDTLKKSEGFKIRSTVVMFWHNLGIRKVSELFYWGVTCTSRYFLHWLTVSVEWLEVVFVCSGRLCLGWAKHASIHMDTNNQKPHFL